ncbi:unnamed protein product [Cochlearia groenlandica]
MENLHRMNLVAQARDCDSSLSKSRGVGDADSILNECVGWTNERHNSYLEYLENSFVKQLYTFLGGDTHRLSKARDFRSNSRKSNDQFKVLHNGYWEKVNVGKKQAHTSEFRHQKHSFRNIPENLDRGYSMGSYIQVNRLCNEESKHSGDKTLTRAYLRSCVGDENSTQSNAEESGQNFEEEEEKECDSKVNRKREREANNDDDSSLKDQVVPVRMVKPIKWKDIKANRG